MKEKVCSIWSKDEQYAVKLADYINERKLLPFQVMVFTDKEALFRSSDSYDTELLVIDGEADWICDIDCDTVIRLSEDEEENCVRRYQSAERLVKEIMSHMTGYRVTNVETERQVKLNCIYSPATKCFKTSLTLGLGLWSAKKEKSLFINLEEFSGLDRSIFPNGGGLSEALYHFKSAGRQAIGKIISCTGQIHGMDYLYPVTCPEDIAELQEKEFLDMINLIADSGLYRSIWIDVGNVYSMPWRLMEISDRVILPEPLDYEGRKKVAQMESYLAASGRTELISKIEKVTIPYIDNIAGYALNCDSMLRPENSSHIIKILGGQVYG